MCLGGLGVKSYAWQTSRAVPAEEESLKAAISIDTRAILHSINPNIYGAFIEHVDRCLYGGVYEENSPLSDKNGFRKDVMKAASEWGVPILRWPGGIFASFYHWENGIGPKSSRPNLQSEAWHEEETNHFGTDEFVQYCRTIGAEPYICVNHHTGTPQEAANWVEYCNGKENTSHANLRRKYGHPEPHNVRYWGLGNEPWKMPTEQYANFAFECGKLMKSVDPTIKLVACGLAGIPEALFKKLGLDPEWNRVVLRKVVDIADYLSFHEYDGNDDYDEELGSIQRFEASIKSTAADIELTKKPIQISVDEWNIWYRKRGLPPPHGIEEGVDEKYNLRDALWTASVLNLFQRMGDRVTMANVATMVNAIGTMYTSDQGIFRQTIYFPLKLYRRECGSQALACKVESPTFSSKSFQDVPYLDVSATLDAERKDLAIAVVNRHQSKPVRTTINTIGAKVGSKATLFEINGTSPEIENSFSKPDNVRIVQKEINRTGDKLDYVFPAHSITVIKVS
jgi:alpha-N-arabinofuranosidase